MDQNDDLKRALAPVVDALNTLNVGYYVGGSVASSFHGATRSTMDVDLVCELGADHVEQFVRLIGPDYYASKSAILAAIARPSYFNLIHMPTAFKVDLFICRRRPFDLDAMRRASLEQLGSHLAISVRISTVEDSVISKLEWFRLTNETSERQWDDVSRLIAISNGTLDIKYLNQAAKSVGVEDLLARILS
jgi:hypothetical protein